MVKRGYTDDKYNLGGEEKSVHKVYRFIRFSEYFQGIEPTRRRSTMKETSNYMQINRACHSASFTAIASLTTFNYYTITNTSITKYLRGPHKI